MSAIPFTLYDFFAYLSTGALWLLGIDYAFAMGWILGKDVGTGQAVVWVIIAFILGHVNSHWASWLMESKIVAQGLAYPSANLFDRDTTKRAWVARRLFAHYLSPFPKETAHDILSIYHRLSAPQRVYSASTINGDVDDDIRDSSITSPSAHAGPRCRGGSGSSPSSLLGSSGRSSDLPTGRPSSDGSVGRLAPN